MKRRWTGAYLEDLIMRGLMILASVLLVAVLATILVAIFLRGFPSLDLDLITKVPEGGFYLGGEGGILNAIVGSLLLAGGGTLLALLLALPIAFGINVYTTGNPRAARLAAFFRLTLDVLWGIPSLVYGAFLFTIMIAFGLRASLGSGILVLALLEIPIMVRAMDEVMRLVPDELNQAALGVGATRLEAARSVLVRQALPGLVAAVLLAFGRGIGDAASVLFTAGYSDRIPTSLGSPAGSLPLAVFFQLGSPFPDVRGNGYATALLLTLMVLLISIASRLLVRALSRNVIK
jgi:phosphate transport system permease protein